MKDIIKMDMRISSYHIKKTKQIFLQKNVTFCRVKETNNSNNITPNQQTPKRL